MSNRPLQKEEGEGMQKCLRLRWETMDSNLGHQSAVFTVCWGCQLGNKMMETDPNMAPCTFCACAWLGLGKIMFVLVLKRIAFDD